MDRARWLAGWALLGALGCGSSSGSRSEATGSGGGSAGPGGSAMGSAGLGTSGGAGGTSGATGPDSGSGADASAGVDGAITVPGDLDLVHFVNPLIGTAPANSWLDFTMASGDVFPGAGYPLGMLALSPDTPSNIPGGYDYRDTKIKGFSLTHFSGRGVDCYQDVPFIPWVGALGRSPGTNRADYASSFSHANESASAGYYKVHLDGINVDVELTTLARAGIERFDSGRY